MEFLLNIEITAQDCVLPVDWRTRTAWCVQSVLVNAVEKYNLPAKSIPPGNAFQRESGTTATGKH